MEWPALNSPPKVNVNITGLSPHNRLYLTGSRTISTSLGINGVIVLGNNDLFLASSSTNAINTATTPGAMIVTNGTGRFIRSVVAGTYNFPVGDMTGTDKASPVLLTVSSNAVTRNIGVNVQPVQHPNDTSTTNFLTRYWKLSDNGGTAACTYTATFRYNAGDVIGAATFGPNSWNGTNWSVLPGSASAGSNTLNITTPLTSPAYPLNTEIAGRVIAATAAATTYTWTGAVSKVWTVAGNWNPVRTTPATNDILQFSDGLTDSVTNMPSETIRRLSVSNGTTVRLINTTSPVLNILADGVANTDELSVAAGSALYFHNTQSAAIAFSGINPTATISGRLEVVSTSGTGAGNTINLSNCVTTVPATGVLAAGTTDNGNPFSSTASTLSIAGTYEHKYTTVKGYIPTATWLPGSQVLIKGITSIAATQSAPNGIRQSYYDFTYNCPSQTGTLSWGSVLPDSVRGTFRMIGSGTASLTMGSISSYKTCVNKFIQTGGTFNFGTGGGSVFRVLDSFVQVGGTLLAPAPSSSGLAELHFGGISGPQAVILNGVAPTGGLDYKISNPSGINLFGTGGMSIFTINPSSSLIISTTAATPINTSLSLQYGTNTTLVYDSSDMAAGTGGITATTLTFPVTAGPTNLTINTGNRDVTIPFTRAVPGTLKMQNGNISMGSDTLTLGSGSTNATSGTLTYTSGVINVTTGTFRRWMSASSSSTAAILFPLGSGGAVRTMSIIPPASGTTWSVGGTLSATHNGAAGLTTSMNVTDGSYTLRSRTNASWHLTPGAGISPATGATFSLRLTSGFIYPWYSAVNLHVMCQNSVIGTHTAGFGNLPDMTAVRSGTALLILPTAPTT